MALIVCVNATSGKDSDVDSLLVTAIGQVNGTDNVVPDGILLVVLTPIDVRSPSRSSGVEDVGWLVFVELGNDCLTVLHANGCAEDLLSCVCVSFEYSLDATFLINLEIQGVS